MKIELWNLEPQKYVKISNGNFRLVIRTKKTVEDIIKNYNEIRRGGLKAEYRYGSLADFISDIVNILLYTGSKYDNYTYITIPSRDAEFLYDKMKVILGNGSKLKRQKITRLVVLYRKMREIY